MKANKVCGLNLFVVLILLSAVNAEGRPTMGSDFDSFDQSPFGDFTQSPLLDRNGLSPGMLYVTDRVNHTIRQVSLVGVVTTFAGSAGSAGEVDGTGPAARFNLPQSLCIDSGGVLRNIDSGGAGAPVRATTVPGAVVTTMYSGSGFTANGSMVFDNSGNQYFVAVGTPNVTKVDPSGTATTYSIIASTHLQCLAIDSSGNLFVSDSTGNKIWKVVGGTASTFLSSIWAQAMTTDAAGNLYINSSAGVLKKITPSGSQTTIATVAFVSFGLAVDSDENLYVTDFNGQTIRKVTPAGVITTLAGLLNNTGSADGTGSVARFDGPYGIAIKE